MTVWMPAELSAFLAAIEGNRNEALFRLMAMTGLRGGEVVGLRWSDVQLDRHRLTVNHAATVVKGIEAIDVPKTRRNRRMIDLDGDTTALLTRHRARHRELFLRLGVTGERPCLHERDRRPFRPQGVKRSAAW